MTYAGFWVRLAAGLLDFLILSPLMLLALWGDRHFRLFDVYYFLPGMLISFFYGVYLVRRHGATPGKRLMKLRIVKVNGDPVTYREALLRYLPNWALGTIGSVAWMMASLNVTDEQFFAATSMVERSMLVRGALPEWHAVAYIALNVWVWGEFVVLLTNKKRRAIHDFIAGTVVIREGQEPVPSESATAIGIAPAA